MRYFQKLALFGLGFAALASFSSPTFAAKKKKEASEDEGGSSSAPYGMAGCGFGAMVIDKNEMLPQIGAWALNTGAGYWSALQTYAISSGTSNCVESRNDVAAMEQEVFLRANFASLSKEAAQGSGETLRGLADVLGCSSDTGVSELARLSQDRYDAIFDQSEPEGVLDNYLHEIQVHQVLAKDCVRAS